MRKAREIARPSQYHVSFAVFHEQLLKVNSSRDCRIGIGSLKAGIEDI
jgi:hypothetical protein